MGIKHQAADTIFRLKTTESDQTPNAGRRQNPSAVHYDVHLTQKRRGEGSVYASLRHIEQKIRCRTAHDVRLLRHRRKPNKTLWHTISYVNKREIRVVDKRHVQSDYQDQSLVTTRMCLVFTPHIEERYRKSFLHLYCHVFYITLITQHWRESRVNDVCTTRCDGNTIGNAWKMIFSRL